MNKKNGGNGSERKKKQNKPTNQPTNQQPNKNTPTHHLCFVYGCEFRWICVLRVASNLDFDYRCSTKTLNNRARDVGINHRHCSCCCFLMKTLAKRATPRRGKETQKRSSRADFLLRRPAEVFAILSTGTDRRNDHKVDFNTPLPSHLRAERFSCLA